MSIINSRFPRSTPSTTLRPTATERTGAMPGDGYYRETSVPAEANSAFVTMTRAVSINASPETVWPWLAQLGRGAGWYSVDSLDNGGRASANHIVGWIPEPKIGDASAIGYLRHVEPGRSLTWWSPGGRFLGAVTRLVVDIALSPEGSCSRLVIRMSADARGLTRWFALWVFRAMDTIMARRQLFEIKRRVETYGARPIDPQCAETGRRDQYQLYEVLYASGEGAGRPGTEQAAKWRQAAVDAGLL